MNSLPPRAQAKIRGGIQVLVSEKHWEGCGGLIISDEHRVTIAAQMARMVLGFNSDYLDETMSVLVYPDAYLAKEQTHIGAGVVVEHQSGRLGEAWYRGPVILSWNDVLATGRRTNYARNVVIHEFAHKLDMRNGSSADGIPAIESNVFAADWLRVLNRDYERLCRFCSQGIPSIIDCYGATNHAEFFAVASEVYFEEPDELKTDWPELWTILERFYRPDLSD